jgi:DNA invertase Pin-like site-specific DNA recombinase
MPADQPVYAIYCRLSRKPAGRKRRDNETVERQEALCRKYAAEQGLAVSEAHVYADNHRSAWKARGPRPRWDAMVAAGKRGEFDGILAYKLDRFSRNVRDAEDLVDLAGKRRVVVDGPNSGRVDLSTAHGRRTFREAAVQAAGESDNTSERARDGLAERAANGLLLGSGRLFGFEVLSKVREYDDDVQPVQRPGEAEVLREVAARMLAGETMAAVAADLNERGITTARGGRWTPGNLARTVGAPRNNGRVMLNGREVARTEGTPILDDDTYAQVTALLAGRKRGRRATGRWPLTGTVRCGRCGGTRTMAGFSRGHHDRLVRSYVCAPGNGGCGMSVVAGPVEAAVKARVIATANDPGEMAALSERARALGEARAAASAEVTRLDDLLTALEAKLAAEEIRPNAYQAAKDVLDRRIRDAEAEAKRLADGAGPAGDVPALTAEEYDELTTAERREVIRRLGLTVTVLPPDPAGPRNTFDGRRVDIQPQP